MRLDAGTPWPQRRAERRNARARLRGASHHQALPPLQNGKAHGGALTLPCFITATLAARPSFSARPRGAAACLLSSGVRAMCVC